jgi:hypothetical protein
MRLVVLAIAILMSNVAPAMAQTTRPSTVPSASTTPPAAWDATVDKLSRALAESDVATLVDALPERVTIRAFDGTSGDGARLLARVSRGSLVFGKTYKGIPDKLATAIADQVSNSETPEEARQSWLISGEEQAKRADTIASEWVEVTLEVKHDDLTAVLLFWRPRPPSPGEAPSFEPVFVLLKGREADGGAVEITCVAYGNPVAAVPKK